MGKVEGRSDQSSLHQAVTFLIVRMVIMAMVTICMIMLMRFMTLLKRNLEGRSDQTLLHQAVTLLIGVKMLHQANYMIWEILKFTFAESFKKEVIRKILSVEKKSEIENWQAWAGWGSFSPI